MKLILFGLGLLLFPSLALASGIKVSPEKLQFETGGKTQRKEIVVANPTADVQLFEVYADDFSKAITANPASFTLEAGNRKTVTITVDPSKLGSGITTTNLSVVGKPLTDSRVQINTGVKIPITISAHQPWYRKIILPIGILVIAIAVAANFYKSRKQKPQQ